MTEVRRYRVSGVRIAALGFDEAVERLVRAPVDGERLRVHFCTTHTVVEAEDRPELAAALNAADAIAMPDGMPLVWVGRLGGRRVERVAGPDTMPAVLDRGRANGARHYFYGGAPGVAERLAAQMSERYPDLVVAGTHCPPFRPLSPDEDAAEVAAINDARPDFVWVGLGSPKQDLWIAAHRPLLDAPVLLAVGAAFDFHSGGLRRAPRWMQRTGTEWLFRLLAEPRRLAYRYTVTNARFLGLLARQVARRRLRDRGATAGGGERAPDGTADR